MNNSNLIFNFNSLRAKKARFSVMLEKKWLLALFVVAAGALLLVGALLATTGQLGIGLIVASFAAWPFMLLLWHKHDLKDIPPIVNTTTLDGVLASNVLGRLPVNPSPRQIADAVMQVTAGHFFVVRFGLGPSFIIELSSQTPADSEPVWRRANDLRQSVGAVTIDGAMLLGALLDQIPSKDQLLAKLQLDSDDITRGVAWHQHVKDLIALHSQPRRTGGIGRDWSFGYTPLLSRFALNVSNTVAGGTFKRDLEGHQEVLDQMVSLLSGGARRNAVLIGQTGTGKTTLVYSLAERLLRPGRDTPKNLHYRQVVALDPSSLIAQARGRGELEALVQQLFFEALRAKNIIIFLDDAQLFLQDGTGSVDLSNLLLPILEGGALRIVLAMDEQRWLRLAQTNPGLAQYMNRVAVQPLSQVDTLLVLEDQLLNLEFRFRVTYMYQSLKEAYRLGSRYVQDQAMPGQAISLLEAAAQFAEGGLVTAASVARAVEKTYGVKVTNVEAPTERSTLLNLEQLIHQRMINQTRAVTVVANALRRARAGVRNQNRPIGTFLFLGPTGVGKTELTKSLAAVYFGGEDRLVRLDLNEFGQAQDATRLLADGSDDPHSLTAQIAKQPFSVVLLDEIEKAHPNVLNTLLQLLDEGVLRDVRGREISFRDAIVIATSNAGAERIREKITAGQALEQFEAAFIDELIDAGTFRPEFLNRFDEIVLFRPLEPAELLQVVDLLIAGVNKSLANQKITVTVSDEAKQFLVQTGYDPRLGARPMRRVVQRTVEDLVARRMLAGEVAPGANIDISLDDVKGVISQ